MQDKERYLKNEKLVHFVLNRQFSQFAFDDDLLQIARLGLWKACISYNEEKSKFSTYATNCIRNEILMSFRKYKPTDASLVSLNEPIDETEGIELADVLPGDKDIIWIDKEGFMNCLTDRQKSILAYRQIDLNQTEISERIGISQSHVSRELRKMRKKFDDYI